MKQLLDKKHTKKTLLKAVQILKKGNLVIFPTETVYGIGSNAYDDKAILKIYKIKKRPRNNPLICHFSNLKKIEENFELSNQAYNLAKIFWPGPLTMILNKKKSSKISGVLSNNQSKVACRIPSHPIAIKMLKLLDFPIAAPSANFSNKLSATNINNLNSILKNKVFVIDGGSSFYGLESTVVDLTFKNPKILRYGSIPIESLKKTIPNIISINKIHKILLSPGQKYKHYSPNTPLRINVKKVLNNEVLLNFGKNSLSSKIYQLNLSKSGNLKEAAKNFYDYLFKLDKKKYKSIAVAPIPKVGLGITINDRLNKASR